MRQGAEWEGMQVRGLDDFLEEVRAQLRQRYRDVNLNNALDEIRQRLEDLVDLERDSVERQRIAGPGLEEKLDLLEHLPNRLSEALERLKATILRMHKRGRSSKTCWRSWRTSKT